MQIRRKTTGFGTAFGATPATTASTSFGFGSSFGATNPQQTPSFGSTFGTPATGATAPTFGTGFGTPASSAAPAFGSTFGAPASSAAPTFGTSFGAPAQQQTTGLFGSTSSKPSLFGTPSTSAPSLFSTPPGAPNLFGSTAQTTGLFGSANTNTTPSLFGPTTSTPSLFGQPATTSAPSLFGSAPATGTTGFGGGLFGTTTSAQSLFGGGFGTTTTTAPTGFGGFGTGTGFSGFGTAGGTSNLFGSAFGAKPAIIGPPAQSAADKNQQVVASVYAINVFNDERDDILKKWNMLQACWGTGKGYYNSTQPPIEYTPQNPFYRFKAMGYNVIPEQDNSDGIVKLIFNKKLTELRNQQEVLKNGIGGILGNKPNLSVEITQIKAVSDNQTEVKITVSEKSVTGSTRKISASDLSAFLNQPTQKQQLSNVGVTSITPFVTPSKAELEEYLKQPPPGIDSQMWQAAIQDNPNSKKYIPVPINGFSDLRSRMLQQEYQTGLHQAFLERVNKDITELKTKHSSSIAQISELKQKYLELQHRILRILVKQESTRKVGIAIQPEEELLRGRFEMMHAQLNIPKQFKGQINELLSNVKMLEGTQKQNNQNYRIDAEAQEEIKQFLRMEQSGIAQLINIINNDLESIKIINEGMNRIMPNNQ
ncbi:hypothetical protein NQ314_013379 [Rhamnusium bicolor]|uniref:Nucleoporin Nup54 alpha-helical domain-containing protein n=1 Tax=Rhamnusium bicolor TaxID=1586634 RepID=A0AAV8X729_9CUCU|nr:hypothetical protein NQ314_013379 [Rhamnusium bicolor]